MARFLEGRWNFSGEDLLGLTVQPGRDQVPLTSACMADYTFSAIVAKCLGVVQASIMYNLQKVGNLSPAPRAFWFFIFFIVSYIMLESLETLARQQCRFAENRGEVRCPSSLRKKVPYG